MTMTRPQMDTPLRRSEVGAFRTPVQTPVANDDEAERREARRRTATEVTTPAVEESETLKNCLQLCNDKLSRDNAWSVSVIDTLSALMSKHHKTLSNFKVAGSSLEASSRVYALRVDSVHSEVVRISSGLSKQKGNAQTNAEVDEVQPAEENTQTNGAEAGPEPPTKRKKRSRKPLSTITKNKDTINALLDTNPFTDPLFAKLNSGVGNISGSNRLLQNVLHSIDSELRLRMEHPFWDECNNESVEYLEEYDYSNLPNVEVELISQLKLESAVLRPQLSGYNISDSPAEQESDNDDSLSDRCTPMNEDQFSNSQMAVAFDINAAVESSEPSAQQFIDVDMGAFDELTVEEQVAINNCKGLRRAPVVIEDMRPVDSSCLEYSYRPLDKISQFWAGPSHWKFKKSRNKSLSLAQRFSSNQSRENGRKTQNQKNRRKPMKLRLQPLEFGGIHDTLFQKLDGKSKMRKANIAKKWDAKKLKLPTDLQIDRDTFDVFRMAPGLQVMEECEPVTTPDIPEGSAYDYDNVNDAPGDDIPNDDIDMEIDGEEPDKTSTENVNQTVMEIASDFIGAPDKVTKIIVPFAKRAKVIDMKQLKKCCTQLIDQQMLDPLGGCLSQPKGLEMEKYKGGIASFNKIYANLPRLLTTNMNEALSTSIAFYSILHLANEGNLRLFMDETLDDFQIRKIDD